MEKAQFPDYFAKRTALKKEYIEWYTKKYGITGFNPEVEGHVHVGEHHDHQMEEKSPCYFDSWKLITFSLDKIKNIQRENIK